MRMPIFNLLQNEEGQDVAEYAVMLAVVLIIVLGAIRLIGSNVEPLSESVPICLTFHLGPLKPWHNGPLIGRAPTRPELPPS
jgi:Flp pilus assembly pilin Flp